MQTISVLLNNLENSILQKGLFHPILLQNDGHTLVAGESRLKAVIAIHVSNKILLYNGEIVPKNHIPFITIGNLSSIEIKEAELEENDIRKNVNFKERATAVMELHTLRMQKAIEKGEKHSIKDTAVEIFGETKAKSRLETVKKNLLVANYLSDEKVAKSKSTEEAIKIIKEKLEEEHKEKLAYDFDLSKVGTPHTIIYGDSLHFLVFSSFRLRWKGRRDQSSTPSMTTQLPDSL